MTAIEPSMSRPRLFSSAAAFEHGWPAFKANYGGLLLAGFLYVALGLAVSIAENVLEKLLGIRGLLTLPLSMLVATFFSGPFNAGFIYFVVRRVRGEAAGVERIFDGFARYGVLVGVQALMLVVSAICMLPVVLGAVLSGVPVVGLRGSPGPVSYLPLVVGFLVTFALSLVIGMRFAFAPVAALDHHGPRPRAAEAMRLSWAMTSSPNLVPLIALSLLLALIALGTALALVLPLFFFGMPLICTVWAAAYDLAAAEIGIGPQDLPPADG